MASTDNTAPNASRRLAESYASAYTDFAPHGPACIYRTGPHWPERQAMDCGYTLRREARPVYNHALTGKWLYIGERIFKHLDSRQVLWSIINPIAYAYEGEPKPFCPLLISIGVTPNSLPYDAAYATAHDSKEILVEEGFPEIDVAIVEYVMSRHCGTTSNSLTFTPDDLPGIRALVKPFTMLLGVPISLLEHPNLQGTGGLIFHLGKDASGKPIIGLLTCAHVALPPPVYGAEYKAGRIMDKSSSPIQYIALGEAGYNDALTAMEEFIETESDLIEDCTSASGLEDKRASLVGDRSGNDSAQRRQRFAMLANLVPMAQGKISAAETLRARVRENCATPSQRLLGSLLYAAPLQVSSPDRFTGDWAMIAVDENKIHQSTFMGNKIYIGDSLHRRNFHAMLYPHEKAQGIDLNRYPSGGLLQVAGVLGEAEFRNPKTLDEHGEPCLFVIKNGACTGTTVGRVNGIETFVRTFAGDEKVTTREIAVVGRKLLLRPSYNIENARFSNNGDSGAIVVTGEGRIVGLLNSGPEAATGATDISFITPYWWLERQIKEKYPDSYLYEGV